MVKLHHFASRSIIALILNQPDIQEHFDELRRIRYFGHGVRVAELSVDVAIDNGITQRELLSTAYAGLLHDLGKADLPRWLIQKRGALSEAERSKMRQHVRNGAERLKGFDIDLTRKVILAHHEYKTNDPYPRKNGDARIEGDRRKEDPRVAPLAQIVAVSDIYDSLAHRRVYKEAMPPLEVMRMLYREFSGDQKYVEQVVRRLTSPSVS